MNPITTEVEQLTERLARITREASAAPTPTPGAAFGAPAYGGVGFGAGGVGIDDFEAATVAHAVSGVAGLSDADLIRVTISVEGLGRLADALRIRVAAEIADRSRHELGNDGLARKYGYTKASHFLEKLTRIGGSEAYKRIRLGLDTRTGLRFDGEPLPPNYPAIAEALTDGSIGVDAAAEIIAQLGQARKDHVSPEDLAAAEEALVENAEDVSAQCIRDQAHLWRERLDPDGAEPRDELVRGKRSFRIGRERPDGMTPFSGLADPVAAGLLKASLSEHASPRVKPRFLPEEDSHAGVVTIIQEDGAEVEVLKDPRSTEQRAFDIVFGMIRAGIRARDAKHGGVRSTSCVTAVIRLEDLENGTGVGWIDDVAEPVSAKTVQELVCDSGFRRMVVGTHGEVLYLGKPERYFPTYMRTALAARDGGCIMDCGAPPEWCDAHHVVEHSHGGPTDIDNGVLLCPAHHHMLHSSLFQLKMINGRPHLLSPPWVDPTQTWRMLGKSRVNLPRAG